MVQYSSTMAPAEFLQSLETGQNSWVVSVTYIDDLPKLQDLLEQHFCRIVSFTYGEDSYKVLINRKQGYT